MTSLRGVTGARDQSLESNQSDLSIKFCKLFWRVAENTGKFLQESITCLMKICRRPLQVTSTRLKKKLEFCDVNRKEEFVEMCCP